MKNDLLSFYISNYNIQDINELKRVIPQRNEQKLDASKKVESLFIQILIKNMRNTLPQNELFDNDQSRLYTDVYDQQIATEITKKGIGLTDMILKQLNQNKSELYS